MIDPMLSLAISMHSNKGVYALLLGSGVSRSAQIPTGWEIVLDLIRKLAFLQNENCEPDPETWFQNTYGKDPDYSELLEEVAKTSSERNKLLMPYFEPTEEEREDGLKSPQAAHKAIAKLVVEGYIRVIITTNFDRLLEMAIQDAGITPTVISRPDVIAGAMPIVHTPCTIIKLHGDYLDPEFRNTTTELGTYDPQLDQYLDRIFDEFGLIICGWSADWDTALRQAILRCPNRRFATYWTDRGRRSQFAQDLINQRRASVISILDSDSFFQELQEKILSLQENNQSHPISAEIAINTLKKYIVSDQYKIRLHDLVNNETERLYQALDLSTFPTINSYNRENMSEEIGKLEALSKVILSIVIYGAYWGSCSHDYLWIKCIERLADPPDFRPSPEINLRLFPALILLYGAGISAIYQENYVLLFEILAKAKVEDRQDKKEKPLVLLLHAYQVMETRFGNLLPGIEKQIVPVSEYLFSKLRKNFSEIIPKTSDYQKCFDRFEYLLSFSYFCLNKEGYLSWAPVGCFYRRKIIINEIRDELQKMNCDWTHLFRDLVGEDTSTLLNIQEMHTQFMLFYSNRF